MSCGLFAAIRKKKKSIDFESLWTEDLKDPEGLATDSGRRLQPATAENRFSSRLPDRPFLLTSSASDDEFAQRTMELIACLCFSSYVASQDQIQSMWRENSNKAGRKSTRQHTPSSAHRDGRERKIKTNVGNDTRKNNKRNKEDKDP